MGRNSSATGSACIIEVVFCSMPVQLGLTTLTRVSCGRQAVQQGERGVPNGVHREAGDEQASSADSRQSHFNRGSARPEYPPAGGPGQSRWRLAPARSLT